MKTLLPAIALFLALPAFMGGCRQQRTATAEPAPEEQSDIRTPAAMRNRDTTVVLLLEPTPECMERIQRESAMLANSVPGLAPIGYDASVRRFRARNQQGDTLMVLQDRCNERLRGGRWIVRNDTTAIYEKEYWLNKSLYNINLLMDAQVRDRVAELVKTEAHRTRHTIEGQQFTLNLYDDPMLQALGQLVEITVTRLDPKRVAVDVYARFIQ